MPPVADDFISRTQGDVRIVRFKTESLVNAHDIVRIHARLSGLIEAGARKLVLDVKNVRYISSATLGMMIALSKELMAVRGKLVISHPEHLLELLKMSKTERLFTLAADPKAALDLF
jgi:anti-anti-sigma factor